MGRLRRLARRALDAARNVNREASRGDGGVPEVRVPEPRPVQPHAVPEEPVRVDPYATSEQAHPMEDGESEDKPWYLDGENDGWDETNPDKGG